MPGFVYQIWPATNIVARFLPYARVAMRRPLPTGSLPAQEPAPGNDLMDYKAKADADILDQFRRFYGTVHLIIVTFQTLKL